MSNIFLISDLHLGHKRILEFCPTTRGGCKTIEEHDEKLIQNWNEEVKPEDTVYILGDISWHNAEKTHKMLSRLMGHKQLILGNHDKGINKHSHGDIFETIQSYNEVKIEGHDVIMCHYPMRTWNKSHHGSFMLYGHEHGALESTPWGRSMDVGVDTRPNSDLTLWSWEEVCDTLLKREIIKHH